MQQYHRSRRALQGVGFTTHPVDSCIGIKKNVSQKCVAGRAVLQRVGSCPFWGHCGLRVLLRASTLGRG